MHRLLRQIRFSINPFLKEDEAGFNSYCSKPAGEGLSIFFELTVELAGSIDRATGFVVNVTDIDRIVGEYAVPVFSEKIRCWFASALSAKADAGARHIGFEQLNELLRVCQSKLADKFGGKRLSRLCLSLNPRRKLAIDCEDEDENMIYFSEKFDFAATHKLWNDNFSEQENFEVFGKCANPAGHGHNYIIEVMVTARPGDLRIADYEKIVDENLIKIVDHKNLNVDVPYFSKVIPTVENIAVFAWEKLNGKFKNAKLHCVTIWETDKTYCSYYGK
jgi:6-pyruvoyltetrahydropterin/6-carboxytetrahydropterin synthase